VRAQQGPAALNVQIESRIKERNAQLVTVMTQLANARDDAESARRAKNEFLANLSHEIRTPMNTILGMTDLALRSEMTARQRSYLKKARTAADSLLIISNDILDFSKIEAGKLDMEASEFSLQAVLDRVTAIVAMKAQEKGLELLLNTSDDVPPRLIVDSLRLEQVLMITSAFGAEATAPARHGALIDLDGTPMVLRGRRVLLVEDNEFNQIVATQLLSDVAGMVVVLAVNGEEAVRRIWSESFDAVLPRLCPTRPATCNSPSMPAKAIVCLILSMSLLNATRLWAWN
jgi:nitrogen-specific signal transduction histidine kinase